MILRKKTALLVLCGILLLVFSACGAEDNTVETNPDISNSITTEADTPTTELLQPEEDTKPAETEATETEPTNHTESVETQTSETKPVETESETTQPKTTEPEPTADINNNAHGESVAYTDVNETVYATSTVNVRKGPGTSYEAIGKMSKGEAVTRTGIGDNGWSKVVYNGQEAYVSSSYLTKTKPESGNNSGSGNSGSGNSGSGNSGSSGSGNSGSGNNDSGSSGESETTKPTESEKVWSTTPGSRPYEYQEVFSTCFSEYLGIYEHCDRYGNVWFDRSPSSNGYGKNIYSGYFFNSNLHYYGNGIWSNFGAYWSEDGSRSGGSFSTTKGPVTFPDIGAGEYVAPYGPLEDVTSYLINCSYAASLYNTIMANETWSDKQKEETVAAIWPSYGVSEADVMGYINNPTTHPFPGLN